LRMKERYPDGKFVEDPRGRALEPDYEIEADADEFLCPDEMTTYTTRMQNIDKVRTIDACSRTSYSGDNEEHNKERIKRNYFQKSNSYSYTIQK